jgi:N-methylhydantoinase B
MANQTKARKTGAKAKIDPITMDVIENALRNARYEMDATLFRTAVSPAIREQHDEFPIIADPDGRMLVGQFGSWLGDLLESFADPLEEGDVIFTNDPYLCGGTISHLNDWLIQMPVHYRGRLVGWTSMFGHQNDTGGPVPSSLPTDATTIFGEAIRIPPFKLYERGTLNETALNLVLANVRQPEFNRADLMGIVAGCRTGAQRIVDLCERFGVETYLAASEALLKRTYDAMKQLIQQVIPEEPQDFEDYVDDDGRGFGPYKVKVTIYRKGDKAYFDYTGTDPQSEGPINYYLNEHLLKMFIGVYLIMTHDPQILFNDGFYPLIEIKIPRGTLLKPEHPAPLSCRTHLLGRQFDILGGALCKKAPQFLTGAGWGSSPHMIYSGYDAEGKWFNAFEIGFGGIPARPFADGLDGHAMWPLFTNQPAELMESYYPLRIAQYTSVIDSGGAGYHRGGNGLLKVYHFLAEGEVSIHDDRWLTYQWGVNGGSPAMRGKKWLKRGDGTVEAVPSKCDHVKVFPGDELYYQTWGGGGYGDPLAREPERVQKDVRLRLVSLEKARSEYGVVIDPKTFSVDTQATEELRAQLRARRGEPKPFDFGPPLAEILRNCKDETGLEPPKPPVFRKQVARLPIFRPKPSHARLVPKDVYDRAFGGRTKRRW